MNPAHIDMRQLIRKLASTPQGYCRTDARGLPGAAYSSQRTSELMAAGEVVRVKVPGHLLRFVRTEAQAAALTAALLASEKKRIRVYAKKPVKVDNRPRLSHATPLRLLIVARAATPAGVTLADGAHLAKGPGAFSKCVQSLIKAAALYRAKVRGWPFQYFSTQAGADQWQAATPPRTVPRKTRPRADKPAKPPRATAYKPRPTQAQQLQPKPAHLQPPGAPGKDAVAVYPEHYRKTVQTLPPPRNQVVTIGFVHNGYGAMR